MQRPFLSYILILLLFPLAGFGQQGNAKAITITATNAKGQEFYKDIPYWQDYSVKYYLPASKESLAPGALSINQDKQVRVLSGGKIIVPDNGQLFYDGKFVYDMVVRQPALTRIVVVPAICAEAISPLA